MRAPSRKGADRYHVPIMITENGIGTREAFEDGAIHAPYRIAYLREHIEQMRLPSTTGWT